MQDAVAWIIALASGAAALVMALFWALRRPTAQEKALPTQWALAARPVFSADERRIHRLIQDALPHHVLLAKLPLVRFCQPTEAKDVRYWFDLLGTIHVTFAICSPNGRVLAAIDLDSERGVSGRSLEIKHSVLNACRVRYLRCGADNLPTTAELQLLVPYSSMSRGPQPGPSGPIPRRNPWPMPNEPHFGAAMPERRPARTGLWQDSSFYNDSFFTPDARRDGDADSNFGSRSAVRRPFGEAFDGESQYAEPNLDDLGGVVVDAPRYMGGWVSR